MTNDNEPQIAEMLRNDALMLGLSDAGAHTSQLCDADFATYLLQHWWREKRAIPLEKAIWRLTRQPAEFFGLADRGRLVRGAVADIVVFDPETVGTTAPERRCDLPAGADRLVAKSTGIVHVWVGGVPSRRGGQDLRNPGAGKLIRSRPS
jgi:N-acyl-D-amino-acid deacylase